MDSDMKNESIFPMDEELTTRSMGNHVHFGRNGKI